MCLRYNQKHFHHLCNTMLTWETIPWTKQKNMPFSEKVSDFNQDVGWDVKKKIRISLFQNKSINWFNLSVKLAEKKCIIQNKKGSNSVSQESKTKIWPNFGFVIRKTKLNWGLVPLRTWYYRSYIWSYPESFHHCLFRSALQDIYTVLLCLVEIFSSCLKW